MPLLIFAVMTVVALIALIPLSLVLRYRTGTSRRRARSWIVGLNVAGMAISVALFLAVAAITNVWAAGALVYATAGLFCGLVLGALGLWLTRWERASASLYYTPNRWLVLVVTFAVSARLVNACGAAGRRGMAARGQPGSPPQAWLDRWLLVRLCWGTTSRTGGACDGPPSVGSRGDAYDNALAESVIGLFKTEVIQRLGSWRHLDAVEFATLTWVDWFNTRRLLEPIGYLPPAEFEARYYEQAKVA